MEVSLENKKYIIEQLELMNEDLKKCKSQQTHILLTRQIVLFEKELLKYRKPILVEPAYDGKNVTFEIEYNDFTEEELLDSEFIKKYLTHMIEILQSINSLFL